ncbi:MAG: type II secretion system protein [Desulfitobacterium sp.]
MLKRKKDGGFTLIELMIVIAVIGILAVVLVPKMSGAKDSAKDNGVITNAKSVEVFVIANIDKWERKPLSETDMKSAIENRYKIDGAPDRIKNPYDNTDTAISVGTNTISNTGNTTVAGQVYVKYTLTTGVVDYKAGIIVYGINNSGDVIYENMVKLN